MELKLKPAGQQPARVTAYHLYSLFLSLVERSSPRLAANLHHDGNGPKPFTLSLLGSRVPWRQEITFTEQTSLNLRLTFLTEEVFTVLADSVWRIAVEETLLLADARVRCEALSTTPAQSRWAAFTTFEELLENAPQQPRLELIFLSPTTFRSGGRRNILFPEPSLVFKSLKTRWNAFALSSLALDITEADISAIRLSGYRLSTRLLDFGSYQEAGFYGTAVYDIAEGTSADTTRKLQALTSFAFFSGIGAKTTMGMGQARRRESARSLPDRAGGYPTQGRRGIPDYQR